MVFGVTGLRGMNSIKSSLVRVMTMAVVSVAISWPSQHSQAQDAHALTEPLGMQTDAITTDTEEFGAEVRALLVPHRQATISSLVSARIQTVHVQDGDHFKQGDVLISFNCDALVASLRSALAKQKQYQLTHDANVELRRNEAVSKLDVALSEAKLEESKANVALARARHQKCNVLAPYDGKVAKVAVNEHESVEVGGSLISILDDAQLEMTLHLPSSWVTTVSSGTKFKVSIDETGKQYGASVIRVSPQIDPTSRTFEVTARIVGKQTDLLAGMSGNAHFELVQ